ncbi:FmdB family zinc ribbon protein [Streptomyces sp. NPDC001292]|uniref:FmdB family zinc ribbon protein n=1 Tax=Streptomyces sp. NPDC001292 TaxID=3364558 RepID=UPI00368B486B
MATYEYLCGQCGPFDVKSAIGKAPTAYDCPACARAARRLYSAPGLSLTSTPSAALREREEQAREAPPVVSEVPPRTRPERQPHPALPRLPRP